MSERRVSSLETVRDGLRAILTQRELREPRRSLDMVPYNPRFSHSVVGYLVRIRRPVAPDTSVSLPL